MRRILLACGLISSVLYVGTDVLAALLYPDYHRYTSQAISELAAIGAPTRPVVVVLFTVYSMLALAFGVGVWMSAGRNGALRVVGKLLTGYGVICLLGYFVPMNVRGAEQSLTDIMHIAATIVTVALILLTIGVGATAFGKRFRAYSIATIVILVVFGALAGLDGPRLAAQQPTPWLGVTERINIGGFLFWVAVLSTALLRRVRVPSVEAV